MFETTRKDYFSLLQTLRIDPDSLRLTSDGALERPPISESPALAVAELPWITTDGERTELELGRALGSGGMGEVRSARQVALDREVAVKLLLPGGYEDRARRNLLREGRVTGRLEHPNVVPVYDLGRLEDGEPALVMKRIEGVPWSAVIQEPDAHRDLLDRAADPLSFHLGVLMRVCEAVHFAHSRGVVHRDLKPNNVMIGSFGEVYVLDWGLAVSLVDDPLLPAARNVRAVAGTPGYMAPEMAAADGGSIGVRTDVYLIGSMLHEVLTNRLRHGGDDVVRTLLNAWTSAPVVYDASVPAELGAIANRATSREPTDRFADAEALRRAIARFLEHRSSNALAEAAAAGLASLRAHIDGGGALEGETLYSLFSEVRFGFQQALAAWPGNATARDGLQSTLEVMIGCELERCRNDAAAALLAELPEPRPMLEAQIAEAEQRQDEKLARLERFRHDADVDVAMEQRARVMKVQAITGSLVMFAVAILQALDVYAAGYDFIFIAVGLCGLTSVAAISVMRRRVSENLANRRLVVALVTSTLWVCGYWAAAYSLDIDFAAAMALALLAIGLVVLLVALLSDGRVVSAIAPFVAGCVATILWPAGVWAIFAVAWLFGFGLLARSWRPRATVSE